LSPKIVKPAVQEKKSKMIAQQAEAKISNRTAKRQSPLARSIRYLGHYPRLALGAYAALFVATAAQLAVPQLIQTIIDLITAGATLEATFLEPGAAYRALAMAMFGVILFALLRGVFAFGQIYLSQMLSENIAFDFRNDLFERIQRLSFSYHDRNQTGQLMVRATDDVERLRVFIGQGLLLALQALVLLVGTLVILFLTNVWLTLVVLPILPVTMVVFTLFGRLAQPLFKEAQERLARVNTILQENLAGLKLVKSFVAEPREQARFDSGLDAVLAQQLLIGKTMSLLFPLVFLLANLGQAAVLYFGGLEIIDGTLTLGEWQKFSLYLVYIFIPMGQLGFIIALMAQASASAERIFEILDTRSDVVNKPGAIDLAGISGHVAFENVTFRYFGGGDAVLKDVTFVAEPGQTVALLGATGSGKTTIINLIPRFYDVSEGRVLIDGRDVRDVTIESLRQNIGIVLQETTLFSGTIRENIAFGRPDAGDEVIVAVARAAAAHDFITAFPQSYDTPVGERGSTLSGGQRQRVAIARALLMNPRILILDDSTSSVDLTTEHQIQQALAKLMQGRTSFVIAQRISTVVNADQILVLENGRIAGMGTHEELMEDSPVYAEIYHSQLTEG
jgi:ATP-binding cassette, subfamily B, multidrug efflux pump